MKIFSDKKEKRIITRPVRIFGYRNASNIKKKTLKTFVECAFHEGPMLSLVHSLLAAEKQFR